MSTRPETRTFAAPDDLARRDSDCDIGAPGAFPFTRGIQPNMYRGRPWTMRQYAGFATAAESNRRYRYLLVAGRHRPERRVRPADADRLRLGPSAGGGRGRPGRRRHRLDRGHGRAVRRHPARPRVDVDDHQRDRDHPAGALRRRRRRRQGVAAAARCPARCRTTSSRNTSRAAPTSIPPRPSLRIVTDIIAFCAREMPQWNTISISGYHIREAGSTAVAGSRVHARARHRLRAGGDRRRPRRQRVRPAALVLLQRAQRLPRGDREVPRRAPAVGAHHARPLRRHESARAAAALPHADRRQHADRAAARQQHRARRAAGARRGARRHAVAALQRPRRGAGAADRGERDDRAAHAADPPARERRRQHRRPGRRARTPSRR